MVDEPQIPIWLSEGFDMPVAVFGAGVTGRAAVEWLSVLKVESVIYDEKKDSGFVQVFDAEAAKKHSLVIASPGFSEDHPWLKIARDNNLTIATEFDLAGAYWQGTVIGITGTNGKTTLTEFLTFAFRSSGLDAVAVGNIGEPLCSALARGVNPEAIAVCEISSFQSAALKGFRPDFVLWTNFAEDHLDRHGDLEQYFRSKYKLMQQSGLESGIYGAGVEEFAQRFRLDLDPEGLVAEEAVPEEIGLTGSVFENQPELRNYLLARELWNRMGMSETELVEAAHAFKKSPHRMELIRSINGIDFWDDSKATNFHAVYGGLSRFGDSVIWIGGGRNKGGDVSAFAERISGKIDSAFLIGETSEELKRVFEEKGKPSWICESLEKAVESAFAKAASGQHILLSPGFASFDMFSGYSERGEIYRKAVFALGEESNS